MRHRPVERKTDCHNSNHFLTWKGAPTESNPKKMKRTLLLALVSSMALLEPTPAQRDENRGGGFGGGEQNERIEPEDLEFSMGVAVIPDRETFEKLSYQGLDAGRDAYLAGIEFVKFIIDQPETDKAKVYFMNTKNYRGHPPYMSMVGLSRGGRGRPSGVRGALCYLPRLKAPNGESGLYIFDFQPRDSYTFEQIQSYYDTLISKAPLLKDKLAFHPLEGNLDQYREDKAKYEAAKLPVHLDADKRTKIAYLPLNPGESFGLLRILDDDLRPSPRDIVICKTLPNQMPRIAGVISAVRQTPLSHVNLRAIQDKVPNAYIDGALEQTTVNALVGKLVHYRVTPQGFSLREATKAEVDQHFAALRPASAQSPKRDLSITEFRPLKDIRFDQSASFGVKTTNLAAMHDFGFPEGTVPRGFGLPFYFYDTFMKYNKFDAMADELANDAELKKDRDALERALKKFRKTIEGGDMPDELYAALTKLQKSFPRNQSIRCRSSTNNEDLPGFSGAGLYDSYTHKPDEGHLSNTIQQVFASLWNFRAFEEREFYRINHQATAMGVLLHPNFKGEKANGVAVTEDILYESQGFYYINTQIGEDLVTNPDEESSPEELLLGWYERDGSEIVRRSREATEGKSLLSEEHLAELRRHLGTIHAEFADLYDEDMEDLKFAMEIEFKITKDDRLSIKQARPWVF